MTGLQIGDEVRIFSHSRYYPAPAGGWAGIVTKVGRKYATASYETQDTNSWSRETSTSRRTIEFGMEIGIERGGTSSTSLYVRTLEQVADDSRKAAALAALRAHGIEISLARDSAVTTQQIEQLAGVVKTWDQKGGAEQ